MHSFSFPSLLAQVATTATPAPAAHHWTGAEIIGDIAKFALDARPAIVVLFVVLLGVYLYRRSRNSRRSY